MNLFVHVVVILLNIYSIVILFIIIQKLLYQRSVFLHLLLTFLLVLCLFSINTPADSSVPQSTNNDVFGKIMTSNVDDLCNILVFFTLDNSIKEKPNIIIQSRLDGLIAGLQWKQSSSSSQIVQDTLYYSVKGSIKYCILGFPMYDSNKVLTGMIKFDEFKLMKSSSTEWNTKNNRSSLNNLINKMY
ncbi:hypothetical protein [Flectobacillus major]|uniref:hypothetical protein n=1 Tax=Flectobacillus major TaxID=103 RepID=UPI0004231257|nr:hypothetical protein [Flectobacillus major]